LCCDALALRITGGSRRVFATALVELEEFREQHAGLTLAASGGVLLERFWQITGPQRDVEKRPPGRFVGALSALLLVMLMAFVVWRQTELRRQVSNSADEVQHLLTSQLLPVSIRMPAQVFANLIPRHLAASPVRFETRAHVTPTHDDEVAAPPPRRVALVSPGLHIADLKPDHLSLSVPRAPAPAAAVPSQAPVLLTATRIQQPVYPLSALEQGIEGKVVVEFSVNADGSVRAPIVVAAQPGSIFDSAAVRALLGWQFAASAQADPARRYRQTFTFTLHPRSAAGAGREIEAKAGCHVVTGSHICRSRDSDDALVGGLLH
jgi:bla regulator protein blaR1